MNVSWPRVVICSVLGGIGVYAGAMCARYVRSDASILGNSSAARVELQRPDPRLSPADVVRLQVDALRAFRDDKSAINQCYVLASPANRAVTGPLDRFTAMVQNPAYGALVMQTGALIGRPEIRDGLATVMVTVLDQSRTAHVFRFFLSKQTDPPNQECWMTDAVIPAREQTQREPQRAPSSGSAA